MLNPARYQRVSLILLKSHLEKGGISQVSGQDTIVFLIVCEDGPSSTTSEFSVNGTSINSNHGGRHRLPSPRRYQTGFIVTLTASGVRGTVRQSSHQRRMSADLALEGLSSVSACSQLRGG